MLSSIIFPVAGILIGVIFIIAAILGTWKKIPVNMAAVITGIGDKKVVSGGGHIVIPVLQRLDMISLENVDVDVALQGTMTKEGVPINLEGVVVAKIKNVDESILSAMEQFHCGNPEETKNKIIKTTQNALEGKLREITATLTVEQINLARESFTEQVLDVAVPQLESFGLELKSFTITEISDNAGYMKALGAKRIAEVTRDAEIAKAEADRETQCKTAEAYRIGETAKFEANAKVGEAEKENNVKLLKYDQERKTTTATTDNAYKIQEAIVSQEVINAEMDAAVLKEQREREVTEAKKDVEIANEQKGIILAETKAKVKEMELLQSVIKPADAQKQAIEIEAEAEKRKRILAAEGDAEAIKLNGEAEAEKIRKIGEAESENIRLKAVAEADGMKQKAQAFKEYGPAAIIDIVVAQLPEIAKAISEPMSKIEKINIIGGGSGNGSGGAADVTRMAVGAMQTVFDGVSDSIGFDLKEVLRANTFEGKTTKNINFGVNADNELTKIAKAMAVVVDGESVEGTPEAEGTEAIKDESDPLVTKGSDAEEHSEEPENNSDLTKLKKNLNK